MVFDWFKRQPAESQPAEAPGDAAAPQDQQATVAAEQASEALAETETEEASSPDPVSPGPAPTPAAAADTVVSA